jgi:ribonuclease P protein component
MPAKKFSFSKRRRLTRQSEFQSVKNAGRVQRGRLILLSALSGQREFRAGFVTSRKTGGAVVRNRVRRRLREIVRKHQHEIANDTWLVTIALPAAARATSPMLEDEWLRLAKRASILAP